MREWLIWFASDYNWLGASVAVLVGSSVSRWGSALRTSLVDTVVLLRQSYLTQARLELLLLALCEEKNIRLPERYHSLLDASRQETEKL